MNGFKGRINGNESVFRYGPGENSLSFTVGNFTPLFEAPIVDEQAKAKARQICSQNDKLDQHCLYDYLSTGNEELAKSTLETQQVNVETVKIIGKSYFIIMHF